jgi:hypothetical protein
MGKPKKKFIVWFSGNNGGRTGFTCKKFYFQAPLVFLVLNENPFFLVGKAFKGERDRTLKVRGTSNVFSFVLRTS